MISQYFTHEGFTRPNMTPLIRVYDEAGNVIETHEHTGDSKESGEFSLASRRITR